MSKSSRTQLLVPIAVMGATWAVRRAMDSAYHRATGDSPPAKDSNTSLTRALTWAISTAVVIAAIEVIISRALSTSDEPAGLLAGDETGNGELTTAETATA